MCVCARAEWDMLCYMAIMLFAHCSLCVELERLQWLFGVCNLVHYIFMSYNVVHVENWSANRRTPMEACTSFQLVWSYDTAYVRLGYWWVWSLLLAFPPTNYTHTLTRARALTRNIPKMDINDCKYYIHTRCLHTKVTPSVSFSNCATDRAIHP